MIDLWYPGGIQDDAPSALWGAYVSGAAPKFLLHTTEGGPGAYTPSPPGPGRTYFGHTFWPNYTLARHAASGRWRVFNHIPANHSARALANLAGGVETNRAGASQVEIAWKAGEIAGLPAQAMDELARLLAWEHRVRGVPLTSGVRWVGAEGYGAGAPQRLAGPAWSAYAGVLGHSHAPENAHWDPGAFQVEALLRSARLYAAGGVGEGDDVTEQDRADIAARVLAELQAQVFAVEPAIRQGNAGNVIGATYNKVGDVQTLLSDLREQLGVVGAAIAFDRAELAELRREVAAVGLAVGAVADELRRTAAGG